MLHFKLDSTPINITAIDPKSSGVSSGIKEIEYKINDEIWNQYSIPISLDRTDGAYTINGRAGDNVGNESPVKTNTFGLDRTGPTVIMTIEDPNYDDGAKTIITNQTEISFTAEDAEVNGIKSGVKNIKYKIGNGDWTEYTLVFKINEPTGEYTIYYKAEDNVGNEGATEEKIIEIDTEKPEVSISSPTADEYRRGEFSIIGTALDNNMKEYKIYYGESSNPTQWNEIGGGTTNVIEGVLGTWDSSGKDGIYTIKVSAMDLVGNTNESKVTIKIDNTSPTVDMTIGTPKYQPSVDSPIVITNQTPITLTGQDVEANGIASGLKEILYAVWNGNSPSNPSFNKEGSSQFVFTINQQDGVYTINYKSEDNVGNESVIKTKTIELDSTGPQVTFISPQNGWLYSENIMKIIGTISDKYIDTWKTEFGEGINPATWTLISSGTTNKSNEELGTFNLSGKPNGNYSIKITAYDKLGNMTEKTIVIKRGEMEVLLTIGTGGKGDGEFNKPQDIALDEIGKIYVTDRNNNRAQVFSAEGRYMSEISSSFNKTSGIKVTENAIYISDRNNDSIKVFDRSYTLTNTFGADVLNKPEGIDVSEELIYVSNTNASKIEVFNQSGTKVKDIGTGQLNHPSGLDKVGNLLYVADSNNNRIVVFDDTGTVIRIIGEYGVEVGKFKTPNSVKVGNDGRIYVTDSGNNRVQVFNSSGDVILIIDDYNGQLFNNPTGLQIGTNNELYVVDSNNERVVKFGIPEYNPQASPQFFGTTDEALRITDVIAYPNPFSPLSGKMTIRYTLNKDANITIKIFDQIGKLVNAFDEIPAGTISAQKGINEAQWDGRNGIGDEVISGVYIVKITAKTGTEKVETTKMAGLKR